MNKLMLVIKKVIKDWEIFEIIMVIVLFPWSLLYILLRIIQEWE